MAKTAVSQWDTAAANNTDVGGIPIDGSVTTPSQVDDIIRTMMAQLKASPAGLLAQTSATDTTADRLLKVGAFGIGVQVISTETDLDNYKQGGGYITPSAGVTNLPSGWPQGRYVVAVDGGVNYCRQTISKTDGAETSGRSWNGVSWSSWSRMYSQNSIVGTVTQTGGVPSDAIIEMGSNANGEYVKMAGGGLTTLSFVGGNATVADGAVFVDSVLRPLTFPAVFISPPKVTATAERARSWVSTSGVSTTGCSLQMTASFSSGTPGQMHVTAKGRWY